MSPSASPIGRDRQLIGPRRRRGYTVAAVVLICSAAWAVENGDKDADSGWAVGTPATAILDSISTDPHTRNILHHLEQSHSPLLRAPGPALVHPAESVPHVAERQRASDGWRASGLNVPSFMTAPSTRSASRPTVTAELPLTLAHPEAAADSAAEPPANGPVSSRHPSNAEEVGCDGESEPESNETSAAAVEAPQPDVDSTIDVVEGPVQEESTSEGPAAQESVVENAEAEAPVAELRVGETLNDSPTQIESGAQSSGVAGGNATTDPITPIPIVESTPPPPLTRQLINLRNRVRSVLKGYYRKPLNSKENDCWEAMHGMLSYGIHSRILQGGPRGEPITAVGWLCYNKPCKGLTLMYVTPQGDLRAKWGVGLQGHSGQLLAMLAQCHVSPEYPIHVGKKEFTINDLIEAEKTTCYPKTELTFKLLAFQHYLDLNERWVNDQGVEWDFPRLIDEEIAQPMRTAACGGTHRLSALSLTVKARVRRGEPLDGEYGRAAEYVKKYQQYAFKLQNRDGSLSTEWFRGRGDEDDLDRRIKTTGHILEWLCYSLDDDELRQSQTIRAVTYLANIMYSNYDHEWEVGPRSHALHALLLYDERVFRPFDKAGEMATYRPSKSTANRSQRRTSSQR